MASNPFFSGRIPPDLYQHVEKHCKEVGESKTEILIKALSTYLNLPIPSTGENSTISAPEVNKEMFEALEKRIEFLEKLL